MPSKPDSKAEVSTDTAESVLQDIEAVSRDAQQLTNVLAGIARVGLTCEMLPDPEPLLFQWFGRVINPLNRLIDFFNNFGATQQVKFLDKPYESWHDALLQLSTRYDRSWKCKPSELPHLTKEDLSSIREAVDQWDELRVGLKKECARTLKTIRKAEDLSASAVRRPVPLQDGVDKPPLSDHGRAVYEILCSLPETEGRSTKELVKELRKQGIHVGEDRIRHLKKELLPYGIQWNRKAGYFIPCGHRPGHDAE